MEAPKVELTIKGEVAVIKPAIGDKIIVAMDGRLPRQHLSDLREQLQVLFPRNEVIVIAGAKGIALLEVDRDNATPVI